MEPTSPLEDASTVGPGAGVFEGVKRVASGRFEGRLRNRAATIRLAAITDPPVMIVGSRRRRRPWENIAIRGGAGA
jgi:hypothetical protein